MKKIKRVFTLLLALIILTTTCSVSVFAANDDNEIDIMPGFQSVYEYGDVNMDLNLDIMDATRISMYLVSLETFNKTQIKLSDVNGDGVVNVMDVTYIQMILAEMKEHKYSDIVYLPILPI